MHEMTEFEKIALTSAATLIGGVVLFLLNSFVIEFFVKPVVELRRSIADVGYSLVYNANYICSTSSKNFPDKHLEISEELRKLSARLSSIASMVPLLVVCSWVRLLPGRNDIHEAARSLIGLSNTTGHADKWGEKVALIDEIKKHLFITWQPRPKS